MKNLAHLIWVYLAIRSSPERFSFVQCIVFQCICLVHFQEGCFWQCNVRVRLLSLCSISCMASLGSLTFSSTNCLISAVSLSNCLKGSSLLEGTFTGIIMFLIARVFNKVVTYSTKTCGHCMCFVMIYKSVDGI